jgi:hypothetical protein
MQKKISIPRSFKLEAVDNKLNKNQEVRKWLNQVEKTIKKEMRKTNISISELEEYFQINEITMFRGTRKK